MVSGHVRRNSSQARARPVLRAGQLAASVSLRGPEQVPRVRHGWRRWMHRSSRGVPRDLRPGHPSASFHERWLHTAEALHNESCGIDNETESTLGGQVIIKDDDEKDEKLRAARASAGGNISENETTKMWGAENDTEAMPREVVEATAATSTPARREGA
mmetsp:Transcript_71635/g.197760  ORF Transcript_71635/g.197760 Transcript_71635/m.197760 type:complete len:159 (+) Transcript_71635:625-1101(+)